MDSSEVRKLAKRSQKEHLEISFLRHWELLHGSLPEPERQHKFHPDRKWRWDFSWNYPDIKLAVEIQGGTWMKKGGHTTGVGQTKDYEKWREGVRLGWKILPFNTSDMKHPADVVDFVAEVLTHAKENASNIRYSPEYHCWQAMIQRCHNPNNGYYDRYGARGIVVCDRWRAAFENFLSDVGPRPSKNHSIDRVDGNGNYEPGNCRWATRKQQQNNVSSNVLIEFNGEKMTVAQWADKLGMSRTALYSRIRSGWKIEEALTAPVDKALSIAGRIARFGPSRKPTIFLTVDGKTLSVSEWAAISGLSPNRIRQRLAAGWGHEDAVKTPVQAHGRCRSRSCRNPL